MSIISKIYDEYDKNNLRRLKTFLSEICNINIITTDQYNDCIIYINTQVKKEKIKEWKLRTNNGTRKPPKRKK